jgi:hypothetical protein
MKFVNMKDFCVLMQKLVKFTSIFWISMTFFTNLLFGPRTPELIKTDFEMRLKQDHQIHRWEVDAQALDLHQVVVSMCVMGSSIGFERSHWGLYMPEPECAAFGIVVGDPVVAELTALEFGLLQSLKSDSTQVIIETGSPRVLDLLHGPLHSEPPEAQIVRRQLEAFRRVHLHLIYFNDLENVFEPYRIVL